MDFNYSASRQTNRLLSFAKICLLACTAVTAACGGGGGTKSETAPAGSPATAAVSTPDSARTSSTASNSAPVISGSPSATVTAGSAFDFMPQATDADGDVLAFSIANKPSWATFNTASGRLSGTPNSSQAGNYAGVAISVSDGSASRSLAAFSIQVVNATVTSTNAAPTISGTAVLAINAGTSYDFVPTATDANGDALTFSIANKPSWASFDPATGELSGTPAAEHVGTYANVVISVSDGQQSASLPAFAINVTATSNGTATLSWTPPTQNTDGSTLTNLAGYRIHYGTNAASLDKTIQINSAGVAQYVVDNLSPATWYFAVKAVSASGVESMLSATVSKKI